MNKPSMRNAKTDASETVARNSGALIREEEADDVDIEMNSRPFMHPDRVSDLPVGRWYGGEEKSL
ncbi:hypothetical protein [Mycetohabitans sp. B46]|uniref:hypothetical protein n=1 Tax=Mycetohabitans sp. B46 TaxID=2772536 RepID=UPI00307F12A7